MTVETEQMVGAVSAARYAELVAKAREWVELTSRAQFAIGDYAVEISPPGSGGKDVDPAFQVEPALADFAEDIGLSFSTVRSHRYVATRWPAEHRLKGVSHTIHKILASVEDEAERWALLQAPPAEHLGGRGRWTPDAARRVVGQQVETPITDAERISAVRDLTKNASVAASVTTDLLSRPEVTEAATEEQKLGAIRDLSADTKVAARAAGDILSRPEVADATTEQDRITVVAGLTGDAKVAATVATSLLRRPDVVASAPEEQKVTVIRDLARDTNVAAKAATDLLRRPEVADAAMADETAKRQVNRAQVDAAIRAGETARELLAPALQGLDHSLVYMELVGSAASFVSNIGRVLPMVSEHPLTPGECGSVRAGVRKVRATCDWADTAIESGNTSMDEGLAALLRGE